MKVMKFNGTIKTRGIHDIVMKISKIGEFYLDSNGSMKCIPTENILKAVNYPKRKRFKIELREHEQGRLVFKYTGKKLISSTISGYYFNHQCIERFYNENSDDQLKVNNLIKSGVLHSEVVSYNLYINGILINAFDYDILINAFDYDLSYHHNSRS